MIHTLKSNSQGVTILTTTVFCHTMHCDVVLIACQKTSQLILCDTASDVQKSPIWDLGSVAGNVDEVEISTVSLTQCPVYSDIHSSTDISKEVNTREGGDRGWI